MSVLKISIFLTMSGALFAQGVDVVKVVSRSAERKVQLPGEFIPFQTVAIHAKVTGFVDRVEVDRGSMVRKGQLHGVRVRSEQRKSSLTQGFN